MTTSVTPEQRHWPRVRLSFPVRARPSQPMLEEFDEILHTENSSRSGCYFTTSNANYKKHLRLFVTVPYSTTLGAINRDYIGEVVRIDPRPNGRLGIAVNLLTSIGLSMQNHLPTQPSAKSRSAG
jgi:hypothetical protein